MIAGSFAWSLLLTSLMMTASAQLLAKWRLTLLLEDTNQRWPQIFWRAVSDGYLWLMVTLMICAVAGWYLAMSRLPIGTMMIMASIITPIIAVGGWYLFDESMTPTKILGIIFVMIGIGLVGAQLR